MLSARVRCPLPASRQRRMSQFVAAQQQCAQDNEFHKNLPCGLTVNFSTVAGFHMCCSHTASNAVEVVSYPNAECPNDLPTNGQHCEINGASVCPTGYTCLNRNPSPDGLCCKGKPACLKGRTYLASGQKVGYY
ncbi:unnamed protein product [Gongylonema pulchrum]|uniref:CC domain-containing protein n=1 Tax=Gongylonema pulchrum TaxID=637853 RepID=A0A183CVN3_9BILA|nr:unnamed protein product [Gongylonema pulchrum]